MGALKQANSATTPSQDSVHVFEATQSRPDNDHETDTSHQEPLVTPHTAGYIEFSPARTSYVGGTHWMAIMQNIPELSNVLSSNFHPEENHVEKTAATDEDEPELLGWHERVDRQDILKAVPSKIFTDSLVAVCFNNTDNEPMIVHPSTFRIEYERFWEDPESVSIMWVGLLFALMCLAVQYQQFSPDEVQRLQIADSGPEKLIRLYREKTIQCLVLGRYSQGPSYAVETLLLYLFIDILRGENTKNLDGPWALWGMLVRIALRAGYQRDGSHFPAISCFQAEARRRVWTIIVGWDLYLSIQFALPRIINLSLCDTEEPRNLSDEDLYQDMVELPPSRPESANTIPQFHVAKNRLLEIFGRISDLTMSVNLSAINYASYSEVMRLDNVLTSTYESIIPVWQPRTQPQDSLSSQTPSSTISVRCTLLTFIYHRAQIVLHRKYICLGRSQSQYMYSRKVCIEAALTILQHQWALYLETQVGGYLCRHGWKFLTLLVRDFLFATAILCAELGEEISFANAMPNINDMPKTTNIDISPSNKDMRDRVFQALSSAYIVWLQSNDSGSSREVKIVVAALKHLIGKAQEAGFGQAKSIAWTSPTAQTHTVTGTNTGGPGSTPSEQPERQPGYGLEVERPLSANFYFGLGHFPI